MTPANISKTARDSQFPSIGIDRALNVQVLWGDFVLSSGGFDGQVLYSQKPPGGDFPTGVPINPDQEQYVYFPRIAVDPERSIYHAVWGTCEDQRTLGAPIFYANRVVGSTSWNLPVQIYQAGNCPNIAVDQTGTVHIVFEGTRGQVGQGQILYLTVSLGGFASEPQRVTESSVNSHHPAIAVAIDGTTHVVWSEWMIRDNSTINSEILYATKAPSAPWKNATNLSNNEPRSDKPTIAATAVGDITVAWQDESQCLPNFFDIFARDRLPSGDWTDIANLSAMCVVAGVLPRRSVDPSLTTDVQSNMHLVWSTGFLLNDADSDIFYTSKPFHGAWLTPLNISGTPGSSRRPSVTADYLQSPHVVWEDNTSGNFDVWYTFDAPKLAVSSSRVVFLQDLAGSSAASQAISISNAGDATLRWTATSDKPWIQLATSTADAFGSTKTGSAAGTSVSTLIVAVDGLRASIGQTITGTVTIDAGLAVSSPQKVEVSLYRGTLRKVFLPVMPTGSQTGW